MKLEDIDRNLKVENLLGLTDVVFLDVRKDPFDVYGMYQYRTEPVFRRIDQKVAEATNDGVAFLNKNTAGGRVRFSTNSPYIAVRASWDVMCRMPHMPLTGSSGFDLYETVNGIDSFLGTFIPPYDSDHGFGNVVLLGDGNPMRSYTIHFPLYNNLTSLEIGIMEGSEIDHGVKYLPLKPVVYYGSSITQGGCASRPGNAYQNIISAKLGIDHVNLGFSGSARGETVMAEYIASLPMSIFVMDYDHNAPTPEHLKNTHKPFFDIIRDKNPDLPVVFVTRPRQEGLSALDTQIRMNIVYDTFRSAFLSGDKNVYFINGYEMFGTEYADSCTVDNCHPNDLGFARMADKIGAVIKKIMREKYGM